MKNLLSVALVAMLIFGSTFGQTCREYSGNCVACLENPNCGYCANSGACVIGSVSGPTMGNCSSWEYLSCSSTIPAPTSPPTEQWWTTFGGNSQRKSFAAQSFSGQIALSELWSVNVSYGSAAVSTADTTWVTTNVSLLGYYLSTGALVVQMSFGGGSIFDGVQSPPTLHQETNSILIQADENLTSYSLSTYSQKWSLDWSDSPIVNFGFATTATDMFVPSGNHMMTLDVSNGGSRWFQVLGGGYFNNWAPTIHGEKQALSNLPANPPLAGGFYILDGTPIWAVQWNESDQPLSSTGWYTVSATNSIVLASPSIGDMVQFSAINVSDHVFLDYNPQILWSFSCNQTLNSINSMSTDGVTTAYGVCSLDGKIVAVNLMTGATTTEYNCPECIAPVIVTNTHIFAISNGCVNAYKIGGPLPVSQVCNSKGDRYNFLSYAPAKQLLIATGNVSLNAISISSFSLQ